MTRLLSQVLAELEPGYVGFGCPGCREVHVIPVSAEHHPGKAWGWNGDAERPTFTPSILVTGVQTVQDEFWQWTGEWVRDAEGNPLPQRCHTFVADGRIQFLGDSLHVLAGQTVDLPPYPLPPRGTADDCTGDDRA